MPQSPRSPWIPNPCSPTEENHNWRNLHRLLGRVPLEPTEDDDGKLLRWSNSQKRFVLISPCQAIADCGGSGGECATPCEHASGITPDTKTVAFGGSLVETGCVGAGAILTGSPYALVCDGPCQYTYLDLDFRCGTAPFDMAVAFAISLVLFADGPSLSVGLGALTGGVTWTKSLTAPYDLETDINGAYTLFSNASSQFDGASLTATISA